MFTQLLLAEPLLRLFVVAALGYVLGRVSLFGLRLGIAAVLFVGLGVGALDPGMALPEIVHLMGLVLFVYTIGLASGHHFFASLRRKGLRDNGFVLVMLLLATGITAGTRFVFGNSTPHTAGIFCGSLTNTPALAAVMQTIRSKTTGEAEGADEVALPVVGYSLAYPFGVLGMIAAMAVTRRFWKIDDAAESAAAAAQGVGSGGTRLTNRTIRVTNPLVVGLNPDELQEHSGINVVFGRLKRDGQTFLATSTTQLRLGDLVSIVGTLDQIERMGAFLGVASDERIALDRKDFDYRRIFVSNPEVAGHSLAELDLPQHFGAVVTRLRRGDVEFVPRGSTQLELGDRVRVLTRPDHMSTVTKFLGDSFKEISEVDVMSLGLGIALGLLLGMIPIPLPGGITLKLGIAGGPLVVALLLGQRNRTGPLVWTLPYGANLTLRQFGLILFLAGVGTRSGYAFYSTLLEGGALPMLLAGAVITAFTAFGTLLIGYKLLKIPFGQLCGMLAALQTQPALLAYSQEQTRNDLPNIGYATVYPLAMIVKILVAQLLLALP